MTSIAPDPVFPDFSDLLGQEFTVSLGDLEPMSITLVEASALGRRSGPTGREQPFQLQWTSTDPRQLEQMTHRLHHPSLGEQDIFLTVIGRAGAGFRYQAIFS